MHFTHLFRTWIYSIGILMSCTGCMPNKKRVQMTHVIQESTLLNAAEKPESTAKIQQPIITVWVHGTKNTTKIIRLSLIHHFFDCTPGLNHKNELSQNFQIRALADTLSTSDPSHFDPDHFYLFGWSGKLCFKARRQAAEELYTALCALVDNYQTKTGQKPIIRIITHSHGGNVALQLAEVMDERKQHLNIDELILLACPVQDRTAHLTQHAAFKKIYALYSSRDLMQIGDPQGAYAGETTTSFFSRRHFTPFPTIRHVLIQYNGRPIGHIEFILQRFAHLLPAMLHEIDTWYTSIEQTHDKPYEYDLVLNITQ